MRRSLWEALVKTVFVLRMLRFSIEDTGTDGDEGEMRMGLEVSLSADRVTLLIFFLGQVLVASRSEEIVTMLSPMTTAVLWLAPDQKKKKKKMKNNN